VNVSVARAAERFEEALVKFPRARILQVEMSLEKEKRRAEEFAGRANDLRDECSRLRKVNYEIHDLYGKIHALAG
jgi:hypothetical protein